MPQVNIGRSLLCTHQLELNPKYRQINKRDSDPHPYQVCEVDNSTVTNKYASQCTINKISLLQENLILIRKQVELEPLELNSIVLARAIVTSSKQ